MERKIILLHLFHGATHHCVIEYLNLLIMSQSRRYVSSLLIFVRGSWTNDHKIPISKGLDRYIIESEQCFVVPILCYLRPSCLS